MEITYVSIVIVMIMGIKTINHAHGVEMKRENYRDKLNLIGYE